MDKPVTDGHIDEILGAMGAVSLDPARRATLKNEINSMWEMVRSGEEWDSAVLPHKELKRWEEVRKAARNLSRALNKTTLDGLDLIKYAKLDDADDMVVHDAWFAPGKIEKWSAAICVDLRRQVDRRQRRPSEDRDVFVLRLAHLYAMSFGKPPRATKGGSWEVFLRQVLAVCTGRNRELSEARVHALWLRIKPTRWAGHSPTHRQHMQHLQQRLQLK